MKKMKKKILEFAKKYGLFEKKKILAAVSGGADSMALLHFLLGLSKEEGLKIAVLHFEHGIRGEESIRDMNFVANYCETLDAPCFIGRGKAPELAREKKITVEMAARILRYEFFNEVLIKEGYNVIATAHHADDQAETVLLNLIRGSGVKGLAAMRPIRGNIIRPFLPVTKKEILEYAKKNRIPFCEDSTNLSLDMRRNRLRHEILPLLESCQEGVREHLNTLSEIARSENDYLEEIAKEKQDLLKKENLSLFSVEHLAVQRRIITNFLDNEGVLSDFIHIEGIRKMLLKRELGKRIELGGGVFAELSYKGLQIFKEMGKIQPATLKIPGINILSEYNMKFTVKILDAPPKKTLPNEYYADLEKVSNVLRVSPRRDGDKIELKIGKKGVKKIFMEEKIERSRRNKYPIIFSGEHVLWIPFLRRSLFGRVSKDTKRVLYIKAEELDEGF
ncbi:MAG: tRNA lysidine(34) synthetase TilS [Selenomonadaceae bacterium]|nr:tRNA lysidine(34) synthetase TilS [Selenomonadaceae bacterium]